MGHKHTQRNKNTQLMLILSLYLSRRNDDSFSLGIVPTRNSQSAYYFMCLINCWLHVTRTRKMTKPITKTSYWEQWRLKSPASTFFTQSFNQAQIKENIKAPSHWPWCGDRWIPAQTLWRGICFNLITSSCIARSTLTLLGLLMPPKCTYVSPYGYITP